jgi:microcystin-dependent protein
VSITEISVRTGDAAAGPPDERPLSDEERQMVTRLFADPIAFPQTFKTWLVAFLEGSDLTLPINSILGLNSILSPSGGGVAGIMGVLPPGLIFPCASPTPPAGTLLCDGRAVASATYGRLYKAIGTTYGGDATNFRLPDIQGRVIVGLGPGHGINENENRAAVNRGPKHHHYFTQSFGANGNTDAVGDHAHAAFYDIRGVVNSADNPGNTVSGGGNQVSTGGAGGHSHGVSVSGSVSGDTSGGGDQDQPAYIVIPYVINY